MRATSFVWPVVCAVLISSVPAAAQSAQPDWSRGTTLSGFAGGSGDSTRTGPAFGGAVGWEITPRLAIDGAGTWSALRDNADAFAGTMRLRMRIAGHRSVDPFVHGGVGLYRAMFEDTRDEMPEFYRRRLTPSSGFSGATFTDPTLVAGGGVSIFLKRWFALRPEAEVTFVMRDGTHVVTSLFLHAVFHFEEHPVTPARRK